jgi:hypothetical protein
MRRRPGRAFLRYLVGAALATGLLVATAGTASAKTSTCTGDLNNFPAELGVLSGTYSGNVQVSGACAVYAGPTVVNGNLTVLPGGTLLAAFGTTNFTPGTDASTLTVNGNVSVKSGGTLILGCFASSFACFDDPNQDMPTLDSPASVGGNLTANQPLGVIVHDATIKGNATENGGGGGLTCDPLGAFAAFGSPAYSDYEDSSVGGNLGVTGLTSCWLGMARDTVGGNMRVINDQLADPDAVEILSNGISGNLICQGNSMVWDSVDISETGLFPRQSEPNTVGGKRVGQCVLASPTEEGGTPGPGPF